MKTHIVIGESDNLKWLACRTSINADIDTIELNAILDCGIPPALDCTTCRNWINAEAQRRRTNLRKWK